MNTLFNRFVTSYVTINKDVEFATTELLFDVCLQEFCKGRYPCTILGAAGIIDSSVADEDIVLKTRNVAVIRHDRDYPLPRLMANRSAINAIARP